MEYKNAEDLSPLRDFLEEVNAKKQCGLSEADMNSLSQVLGENGFGLVRDIKQLSADWMSALGMPPKLMDAVLAAMRPRKPHRVSVNAVSSVSAVSAEDDLVPEAIEFSMSPTINYDGLSVLNLECLEALRVRVAKISPSAASNAYLLQGVRNMLCKANYVDMIGDLSPALTDEELKAILERAEKCKEVWGVIATMDISRPESAGPVCCLCHKAITGPTQTLACQHTYCPPCINRYINNLVEKKEASSILCPVAQCGIEMTAAVVETLLMPTEYARYLEFTLAAFVERDDDTFVCPGDKCNVTISIDPATSRNARLQGTITETTDSGRTLTPEEYKHFLKYRIRCHSCQTNFCAQCKTIPYHKGFTCKKWEIYLKSRHCRFCQEQLTDKNTSRALIGRDICKEKECLEKWGMCCERTLKCGCPCNGVKDEKQCLPCLKCELKCDEEWCTICYSEELRDAPCIQLTSCKHVYHYNCVKSVLEAGQSGARIQFDFAKCPQDKINITHLSLGPVLGPILKLKEDIEARAMARLKYEGRLKDPKIYDKEQTYYNDPVAFAMHEYVFYPCHKCKKPYFAGGYQCDPSDNLWDPEELICPRCQPKCVRECDTHGTDWISYKCRYCCNTATFFCWGQTRFCANCHKPDTWKKLAVYKTGKNKQKIWEYKQCPGLQPKVTAIGRDKSLSENQKNAELEKLFSDPRTCSLKIRHPPNGIEFGMGCSMCQDKEYEEDNVRAAAAAADEKNGVFKYKTDFDQGGIIYHIGTDHGRSRWFNPAVYNRIKITSSALSKASAPATAICGRTTARCIAEAQPNAWFLLNLLDQTIAITHYTLRHTSKSKTDALRNWKLLGSLDGRTWITLVEHQNDHALGPNDTHTWKVRPPPDAPAHFRCFCIMQTGPNASGRLALHLCGFEVYGKLTAASQR